MKALLTLLAALLLSLNAQAQNQNIQTVAQADEALAWVARDRAAINAEYAASERECSTRFFVNHCLDQAKEKRRVSLAGARAVEVQAQHFKRVDSVARRDADLAERARKDADEASARAAQPPKPPREEKEPLRTPPKAVVVDREAEHAAKLKRLEQQDAADAGKRAANVAAFQTKKAESERRQQEVVRKKAESAAKAEKAAAHAAEEKKKADAAAAAAAASAK